MNTTLSKSLWRHLGSILLSLLAYAAIFLGCTMLYLVVVNPKVPFTVTQDVVQAKVDEKLPFHAPPTKGLLKMQFTIHEGAKVAFKPDGRIGIEGTFTAKPTLTKESHYVGTLTASGTLLYDNGAFFIRDVEVESLSGSLHLSERVQAGGKIVSKVLDKAAKAADIDPSDVDKLGLKEKIRDRAKEVLLNKLEHLPVYKLNGSKWWHWFASSSLEEVKVSDQSVTAVVSLRYVIVHTVLMVSLAILGLLLTLGWMYAGPSGLELLFLFALFDT